MTKQTLPKKVLFIGDIHGLTEWYEPAYEALNKGAEVVFLGDYLDSFFVDPKDILENLKNIIEFKKKYENRVTLLLGNHDVSYFFGFYNITGFQGAMQHDYHEVLKDNWDLFDLAWGFQGKEKYTLATHAGLTKYYYDVLKFHIEEKTHVMHEILVKDAEKPWRELPLHELINYFKAQGAIIWKVGRARGGIYPNGGILWADKHELTKDPYPGIDQVVGHTPGKYIEMRQVDENKLYFVDNYGNEKVFSLMLELT